MKNIILIIAATLFTLNINAQLTVDTSNGNVGVGDSTPESKLTVNGTVTLNNNGTRYQEFTNNFNGTLSNSIDKNGFRWRTPEQTTDIQYYQLYNYAQEKMFFDDDSDYTNGVGMSITKGGAIGIGNADPLNTLHVTGDALFASNAGSLKFGFPTANGWGFATIGGGATLMLRSYTNTSTEAGAVTRMQIRNTGVLEFTGDIAVTGEYLGLSDKRVKKNIESISNGLDKINAMNAVSYDLRTDEFPELELKDGTQFGLIAQELALVEESLVKNNSAVVEVEGEEVSLMSVNYTEIIPFLIAAVQELNEKLEKKEAIIEASAKDYETLSARMDALEAMISVTDDTSPNINNSVTDDASANSNNSGNK